MPFGYSLRGHCCTERRKDRWFGNPKGIVSSSPATESARLPWVNARAIFNPNGVVFPLRHRATTPSVVPFGGTTTKMSLARVRPSLNS